jgi:hypothetical protein
VRLYFVHAEVYIAPLDVSLGTPIMQAPAILQPLFGATFACQHSFRHQQAMPLLCGQESGEFI